jgi:NtrC-family two-component system response regulator AlgB
MDFLVIDDDRTFRDAACYLIENEGHFAQPASCGEAALANLKENDFDVALLDVNLGSENGLDLLPQIGRQQPNLPVVVFTAQGTVNLAVEAMRRGALDFLEKPFTREQFHRVLARMQRFQQMSRNIERLEQEVQESKSQNPELLLDFATPRMQEIMAVLAKAARTPASILLLGESGTGKSVLARVIHEQSHLADKPLVTVSCPSLSKELLESELFGHTKGAFTGAVKDRWGKVKAADGGTLFLDEIGDLPLEIQPKLLRLLQEQEYERLGENVTRRADLRVIAATNRDLKRRMGEGAFREDLYFRLNVIAVEVPPLRSRPGDLGRLAEHYLKHFAGQCGRAGAVFAGGARERIQGYGWPGNLRELRNAIERAVILSRTEEIGAEDLPLEGAGGVMGQAEAAPQPGDLISLEKLEEYHIRKVLERTRSIAEAARVLGIDQATIYRKRKRMESDLSRELQPA